MRFRDGPRRQVARKKATVGTTGYLRIQQVASCLIQIFPGRHSGPPRGFTPPRCSIRGRLPVRTFLPTGYEPHYPYPLLVFFHGHGGNEEQILRLAPRLSRRNYICISLRGPQDLGVRDDGRSAYAWGGQGQHNPLVEDYVLASRRTDAAQLPRPFRAHLPGRHLRGGDAGLPPGPAVSRQVRRRDFAERHRWPATAARCSGYRKFASCGSSSATASPTPSCR